MCEAGQEVLGAPAQPAKAFFREVVTLRKLARGPPGKPPRARPGAINPKKPE